MERVLHTLGRVKFKNYLVVLDDYHLARDARLNSLLLRLAQEEMEGLSICWSRGIPPALILWSCFTADSAVSCRGCF